VQCYMRLYIQAAYIYRQAALRGRRGGRENSERRGRRRLAASSGSRVGRSREREQEAGRRRQSRESPEEKYMLVENRQRVYIVIYGSIYSGGARRV